jgi:hypothetical protein
VRRVDQKVADALKRAVNTLDKLSARAEAGAAQARAARVGRRRAVMIKILLVTVLAHPPQDIFKPVVVPQKKIIDIIPKEYRR